MVVFRKWRDRSTEWTVNRSVFLGIAVLMTVVFLVGIAGTVIIDVSGRLDLQPFVVGVLRSVLVVALGLMFLQFASEPSSLSAKFVATAFVPIIIMTQVMIVPVSGYRLFVEVFAPSEPASFVFSPTESDGYRVEGIAPILWG